MTTTQHIHHHTRTFNHLTNLPQLPSLRGTLLFRHLVHLNIPDVLSMMQAPGVVSHPAGQVAWPDCCKRRRPACIRTQQQWQQQQQQEQQQKHAVCWSWFYIKTAEAFQGLHN
jgi:hypothetical protein